MRQRAKVTEKTFNAVKIMLAGGASQVEIGEYLQLTASTIYRIKNAESWDDYRANLAAIALAKREKNKAKKEAKIEADAIVIPQEKTQEKPQEKPQERMIISSYQVNRMIELQSQTLEILKILSNKVAFIVDELVK